MSHQTQMNGRSNGQPAGAGFRANVAGLLHDGITLAELQTQLVGIDLQETWQRSVRCLAVIAGSAILALGTVPLLLLSIGWLLVNRAGWTEEIAFFVVAVAGLLIAGLGGGIGWIKLRSAVTVLSRSKDELTSNVRWVKDALQERAAP